MTLDRPSLKRRAVEIIRGSQPKVIYVALVYVLLTMVVAALSGRLMGVWPSQEELRQLFNAAMDGNYNYAMNYFDQEKVSGMSSFINTLLNIVTNIVSAGFVIFLLNTIRNAGPCYGNLLDGFGCFLRIIILDLLMYIFITLWSMLLIVPGIIAAYRYSMAIYILLDNPDMSPLECIRESKRMMTGHKAELFMLDLSFIGWGLLSILPVVGYLVSVWTTPYIAMTKALYYVRLRGEDISGQSEHIEPATPWQ